MAESTILKWLALRLPTGDSHPKICRVGGNEYRLSFREGTCFCGTDTDRYEKEREMRVLMADGDEAFLEVAQCYLARHGYEIKTATNGLETVAVLRRDVPDVVVLDQELLWGGSDGVRDFMQQVPGWSEIPVILTFDDEVPEKSRFEDLPFVAQLRKPYRLQALLDHLQACRSEGTLNPA